MVKSFHYKNIYYFWIIYPLECCSMKTICATYFLVYTFGLWCELHGRVEWRRLRGRRCQRMPVPRRWRPSIDSPWGRAAQKVPQQTEAPSCTSQRSDTSAAVASHGCQESAPNHDRRRMQSKVAARKQNIRTLARPNGTLNCKNNIWLYVCS